MYCIWWVVKNSLFHHYLYPYGTILLSRLLSTKKTMQSQIYYSICQLHIVMPRKKKLMELALRELFIFTSSIPRQWNTLNAFIVVTLLIMHSPTTLVIMSYNNLIAGKTKHLFKWQYHATLRLLINH